VIAKRSKHAALLFFLEDVKMVVARRDRNDEAVLVVFHFDHAENGFVVTFSEDQDELTGLFDQLCEVVQDAPEKSKAFATAVYVFDVCGKDLEDYGNE
jgi:hypothetical protein